MERKSVLNSNNPKLKNRAFQTPRPYTSIRSLGLYILPVRHNEAARYYICHISLTMNSDLLDPQTNTLS